MNLPFWFPALLLWPVVAEFPAHLEALSPQYGLAVKDILSISCSVEYQRDLDQSSPECVWAQQFGPGCGIGQVLHCLQASLPESWKANFASAAVLLGLMPTTLSIVGSTTLETGLLSLRRPLLPFLLGVGSPAVFPVGTFESRSPAELLRKRSDRIVIPNLPGNIGILVLVGQHLITLGAIANLVHVSWPLCASSLYNFALETQYLLALWAFIAIEIHVLGALAVALRVQTIPGRTLGQDRSRGGSTRRVSIPGQDDFPKESVLFIFLS